MFLLKEAYDSSSRKDEGLYAWDEAEWVKSHKEGSNIKDITYRRIYQWVNALLYPDRHFNSCGKAKWGDTFDKIAIVNVKKTNGVYPSDDKDLKNNIDRNGDKLLKQIKMINPDVIVCGYTCWLLDKALNKAGKKTVRAKKNSLRFYRTADLCDKEIIVIDFWHPAYRKKDEWLYQSLQESYNLRKSVEIISELNG